jgi:hypothetical protein
VPAVQEENAAGGAAEELESPKGAISKKRETISGETTAFPAHRWSISLNGEVMMPIQSKGIQEDGNHKGVVETIHESPGEDEVGTARLRASLANHSPEMRLKDLLLQNAGLGDLSIERFLRIAASNSPFSKKTKKAKPQKATDSFDTDSTGSENSHPLSTDEEEDDTEDEDDFSAVPAFAGQLEGLEMNPQMVDQALKMLMMLNNGFKAKHCTCKEGGPHTCMSPAVSQLASQVHTTLQSLNASVNHSKVTSRRTSFEREGEKRLAPPGKRRSNEQAIVRRRSSEGHKPARRLSSKEGGALLEKLSMEGKDGSPTGQKPRPQLREQMEASESVGEDRSGTADAGAGPSSSSPAPERSAS